MMTFNSTTIMVTFQTDNDTALLSILFVYWILKSLVSRFIYELIMVKRDFTAAFGFTGKVVSIGIVSLVWGLL